MWHMDNEVRRPPPSVALVNSSFPGFDLAPFSAGVSIGGPLILRPVAPDAFEHIHSGSGTQANCVVDAHCNRSAMLRSSDMHRRAIQTVAGSNTHPAVVRSATL